MFMPTASVSASQIRAARHLANLSQADVAKATGMSLPTIRRAESEREVSVSEEAIAAIRAALELVGVIFVEENGEGPGAFGSRETVSVMSATTGSWCLIDAKTC